MKTVKFTIIGKPKSKGRPRFFKAGNKTIAYTPKETAVYENLVKLSYEQMCGDTKLEGNIKAIITAYFTPPTSESKKKKEQMLKGEIAYTKKPDTDNIAKIVLDSLNGIAYDDDCQIVSLSVDKKYGPKDGVVVELKELS